MKITEMEGKVLKKVVKRFMVLVLVITLATCNTGTGFSLVKAEEIVENKQPVEDTVEKEIKTRGRKAN